MKIRSGFVSNSSSSSFIVAFSKKPENVEELKEIMFGDKEFIEVYYGPVSTQMVAQTVFEDICRKTPLSDKEIKLCFEGLSNYDDDRIPKYNFDLKWDSLEWKEHNKTVKQIQIVCAKEFLKNNPNNIFYLFEYFDNDGLFEATLEHGNIFENLPHVKINNH